MDKKRVKIDPDLFNDDYYSDHVQNQVNFGNISLQNQFNEFDQFHEGENPFHPHIQGIHAFQNSPIGGGEDSMAYMNQNFNNSPGSITDEDPASSRFYNFHVHRGTDNDDESTADSSKSKKRKISSPISIKTIFKKSILEDILDLLDDGRFGVRWAPKIDSEGDEQDGILIYNEDLLERTLQERRNVKSYGLSKHLAKDLRYYGFMYDKDQKMFWNEDHKHPVSRKSNWQKSNRSLYVQLKRITSESERNLSRLLSLVQNVELAEILKNPEIASKVCPPPNKYINLNEISTIINDIDIFDINNISLLLSHSFYNNIISSQFSRGLVPTSGFDKLLTRMGGSLSNFLENFREFVKGAKQWYHGFIESDEATDYLRDKNEGTFLIRESTTSDCYSLSWTTISEDGTRLKVNHMRISNTNPGYRVNTDLEPSRTLPLWIKNHSEYLRYPFPSSKFENLIIQEQPPRFEDDQSVKYLPKDYISGFPGFSF